MKAFDGRRLLSLIRLQVFSASVVVEFVELES